MELLSEIKLRKYNTYSDKKIPRSLDNATRNFTTADSHPKIIKSKIISNVIKINDHIKQGSAFWSNLVGFLKSKFQ